MSTSTNVAYRCVAKYRALGRVSSQARKQICTSKLGRVYCSDASKGKVQGNSEWQKKEVGAVYGSGSSPKSHSEKRVTLRTVMSKYERNEKISVVTAYDYPTAKQVDIAGADVVLVGDSAGMVVHGYDTTLPLTLDEMLVHCRSVARGVQRALCIGDLPFGSYEENRVKATDSAIRMLKEGVMDAIKIEGGNADRIQSVKSIVSAGVAVMGHTGLTPQSVSLLGGFRSVGKTAIEAEKVINESLHLQEAGCFSIVLECVPSELAKAITATLDIPTIGIGSGPGTSGQVLVYHDMLGMLSHPHHESVTPRFAKRYANIGDIVHSALQEYCKEVSQGTFPCAEYSPYKLGKREKDQLEASLRKRGMEVAADALINHS